MNSSTLCSLILCLITISHHPLPANARAHGHRELIGSSENLIKQICKETFEEEINCMSILRADPQIVHATNIFGFSKAILELALKKGEEGQNFLKGLVKTTKSEAIASCANKCYDGVVGSFSSALAELKVSPDTASYDAKVAGDGSVNCETALANAHILNPAISSLNHQIWLLSKIASLATNKITM
ncbi:unnamed protein product [Sphenostylis stenocarpa]|uniref:Pectinesterase inhibitor domain-containing protein n=1 Tax=Sphenostylis stenocarpa TaxID=92480 RepID=A0AA86W1X8_9FABA|nr:unnamed protein product [Sphenostylis stenocarpa]